MRSILTIAATLLLIIADMRLVILISAMLIGLILPSVAQTRTSLGFGKVPCGTWTYERFKNSNVAWAMQNWALGFLSGSNWTSDIDRLQGHDAKALYGWLDNYCRDHPLDSFPAAVTKLAVELANQAERR